MINFSKLVSAMATTDSEEVSRLSCTHSSPCPVCHIPFTVGEHETLGVCFDCVEEAEEDNDHG